MIFYSVIKTEICSQCEGNMIVEHPCWQQYWQSNPDAHKMSNEQDLEWFRENGYPYIVDIWELPPESIDCPSCEGVGHHRTEHPLSEALAEMGIVNNG